MLKNRPFQKGLGTGLIAGALLLQIMISVKDHTTVPPAEQTPAPAKTEITAELVKEKADSLHLQVYDKGVKLYGQKELDDAVAKAAADAKAEAEAKAKTAPVQTPGPKQINIYITPGMTAGDVGEALLKSGVIADRGAFEQALQESKLTYSIRVGLYTFHENHDLQDILKQLTTVK